MQVFEVGLELEAGLDAGVVSDAEAVPAENLAHPGMGAPSLRGHQTWSQQLSEEEDEGRGRGPHL